MIRKKLYNQAFSSDRGLVEVVKLKYHDDKLIILDVELLKQQVHHHHYLRPSLFFRGVTSETAIVALCLAPGKSLRSPVPSTSVSVVDIQP